MYLARRHSRKLVSWSQTLEKRDRQLWTCRYDAQVGGGDFTNLGKTTRSRFDSEHVFEFELWTLYGRSSSRAWGSWFNKWQWLHYESTTDLAFCHTCVTAIKTGKMKIAGNVKDSAFIYNGLHFPQMKLASEKPPEAVLEGEFSIFLGEHAPRPPYIMACKARHPSSLMGIWLDRVFFGFLRPYIWSVLHMCIAIQQSNYNIYLWWYIYLHTVHVVSLLELLVIRGVPFRILVRPRVSVPLNSQPVAHYRKGGTTPRLKLS